MFQVKCFRLVIYYFLYQVVGVQFLCYYVVCGIVDYFCQLLFCIVVVVGCCCVFVVVVQVDVGGEIEDVVFFVVVECVYVEYVIGIVIQWYDGFWFMFVDQCWMIVGYVEQCWCVLDVIVEGIVFGEFRYVFGVLFVDLIGYV